MKVYFDARMIGHPGIGRYIRCLLSHIALDTSLDLNLLGDREKIKKILPLKANIVDFNYPIYSIQEQFGYLKIRKTVGDNVLHIPHYNVPALAGFNLVSTVHDLIHITYPQGASGALAPVYMRFMMKRILRTASGIICVSEATKKALGGIGKPGCAEPKVIYEGVDEVFGRIEDRAFLSQVKKRYNLPDKFLLYVGSIRRHKNIKALLDAFSDFRKKNAGVSLVMVGRRSQDIDIDVPGVIYLGELASDKELAAVYNSASCLFNLSLHEGFGLTILEAQRCGLPVVCSDIPAHREIGGKGALFAKASYIDQIYENLYNVLFNNDIKSRLVSDGTENVKRFNWASTAAETLGLYRKIDDESRDSSRLAAGNAGRRKSPQCFLQNISQG